MIRKKNVVLTIDAGTSSVKLALVDFNENIIHKVTKEYSYSISYENYVEFDFETLWSKIIEGFKELSLNNYSINGIGLSVLCPGLVPLDKNGNPLRPAIIHLDRRSIRESKKALNIIGSDRFLSVTANLPYPGGISLTSILWIKYNEPDIYQKTYMFGHTNTFILKRFTDEWCIDTTNASFTGLFNTMKASSWDIDIIRELGLDHDKLPPIFASCDVAGKISSKAAKNLVIPSGIPVVTGAGDTSCAALGAGVLEEGDILNSTGTVDVMVLSTQTPKPSKNYLIRTHAVPDKWLIMNIIPTGGEAIEWVRREFYKDINKEIFYNNYLYEVLKKTTTSVKLKPYFSGDRTSFRQRKAVFSGITLSSTRDDLLRATCYALVSEIKMRFKFYYDNWQPSKTIKFTGGGIKPLLEMKKKAFPEFIWEEIKDATILGAAKLAMMGIKISTIN